MVGQQMYSDTQPVSTERLLRAVADPDCRAILRHLHETADCEVDVDDLAELLESRSRPTDSESGHASIELHHTHLPMLADANVIELDRKHSSVTYRGDDRIGALLEFVAERFE